MIDNDVLIDVDAMKSARNVMKQKFARIIQYYFEDTQTYLDSIADGLAKQDVSLIVPAAHTIKSSSRQLGAIRLADAAYELENAAKSVMKQEKAFSEIVDLAKSLQPLFTSTMNQMEVAMEEVLSA